MPIQMQQPAVPARAAFGADAMLLSTVGAVFAVEALAKWLYRTPTQKPARPDRTSRVRDTAYASLIAHQDQKLNIFYQGEPE